MRSRTQQVGGIAMRWEEQGDGIPVVLVHGIPTSPAVWRGVAPRLEGARALAWEMVGYGDSIPEGRGRDISVGRQADHLVAWLEALGIRRAILAGHDVGGGVVQVAAVRHRERVAGLFLTNSVGYDNWPVAPAKALRSMGALVERLPDAVLRPVFGAALRALHDDPRVADESFAAHWPPYARHDGAAALVRQARSLHAHDTLAVRDQLPTLRVPARVVWGAADRFLDERYGEFFARDLGTPLRRIPGARHFTPEDHPDEVADALNSLIAEVAASGGAE